MPLEDYHIIIPYDIVTVVSCIKNSLIELAMEYYNSNKPLY